jgi:hypothetical protein
VKVVKCSWNPETEDCEEDEEVSEGGKCEDAAHDAQYPIQVECQYAVLLRGCCRGSDLWTVFILEEYSIDIGQGQATT